ncbi:MAG TPA: amidohydrolase family protein [Thermodesulfobacteriota bacterium]|nr:amidohydrolase family protein [Thermodesulfobacteriota bacterium]
MIIDCHTHIFPDEVRKKRNSFCEKDEGFSSIYRNPKSKVIGVEELIASMDEEEIASSVICGFSWKRPDLCHLHNQYLLEAASRYPRRLIVFSSLSFQDPDASMSELEDAIEEGVKGIGEIAFYDREMTSQDLDLMKPVLTEMEGKKIPLLLHTNETIGHPYPGKGETPLERFCELALSYPNLSILLAHWGGGILFYELMPEIAQALTHVYYDTAASPFLYSNKIYSVGCEIVGADKIFFGSDFPLIRPRRYFQEMNESGVKPEDQKKILGHNLSKLLGLD